MPCYLLRISVGLTIFSIDSTTFLLPLTYYYRLKYKQYDISCLIITYHIIILWFTYIRNARLDFDPFFLLVCLQQLCQKQNKNVAHGRWCYPLYWTVSEVVGSEECSLRLILSEHLRSGRRLFHFCYHEVHQCDWASKPHHRVGRLAPVQAY